MIVIQGSLQNREWFHISVFNKNSDVYPNPLVLNSFPQQFPLCVQCILVDASLDRFWGKGFECSHDRCLLNILVHLLRVIILAVKGLLLRHGLHHQHHQEDDEECQIQLGSSWSVVQKVPQPHSPQLPPPPRHPRQHRRRGCSRWSQRQAQSVFSQTFFEPIHLFLAEPLLLLLCGLGRGLGLLAGAASWMHLGAYSCIDCKEGPDVAVAVGFALAMLARRHVATKINNFQQKSCFKWWGTKTHLRTSKNRETYGKHPKRERHENHGNDKREVQSSSTQIYFRVFHSFSCLHSCFFHGFSYFSCWGFTVFVFFVFFRFSRVFFNFTFFMVLHGPELFFTRPYARLFKIYQ